MNLQGNEAVFFDSGLCFGEVDSFYAVEEKLDMLALHTNFAGIPIVLLFCFFQAW